MFCYTSLAESQLNFYAENPYDLEGADIRVTHVHVQHQRLRPREFVGYFKVGVFVVLTKHRLGGLLKYHICGKSGALGISQAGVMW